MFQKGIVKWSSTGAAPGRLAWKFDVSIKLSSTFHNPTTLNCESQQQILLVTPDSVKCLQSCNDSQIDYIEKMLSKKHGVMGLKNDVITYLFLRLLELKMVQPVGHIMPPARVDSLTYITIPSGNLFSILWKSLSVQKRTPHFRCKVITPSSQSKLNIYSKKGGS